MLRSAMLGCGAILLSALVVSAQANDQHKSGVQGAQQSAREINRHLNQTTAPKTSSSNSNTEAARSGGNNASSVDRHSTTNPTTLNANRRLAVPKQ